MGEACTSNPIQAGAARVSEVFHLLNDNYCSSVFPSRTYLQETSADLERIANTGFIDSHPLEVLRLIFNMRLFLDKLTNKKKAALISTYILPAFVGNRGTGRTKPAAAECV